MVFPSMLFHHKYTNILNNFPYAVIPQYTKYIPIANTINSNSIVNPLFFFVICCISFGFYKYAIQSRCSCIYWFPFFICNNLFCCNSNRNNYARQVFSKNKKKLLGYSSVLLGILACIAGPIICMGSSLFFGNKGVAIPEFIQIILEDTWIVLVSIDVLRKSKTS